MGKHHRVSRRDFMRGAVLSGTAIGSLTILGAMAKGQGRVLKVGLIGCGARGNGALAQHVKAAGVLNGALGLGLDIRVAAAADYFRHKATLTGKKYDVPRAQCFGGYDGYRKLLATDVDIVLMTTPAVFRPLHFEAAVDAGKHVFMEKPGAVDPPGCRRLLAAGERAKHKGLMVIAGLQRRHAKGYIEAQAAVAEGAIGKIIYGRASSCIGLLGASLPIGELDEESFIATWVNWVQMSGDCIVDALIHELDVANWFLGAHPVSAVGFGGRARRRAGNQYDFFSVDFEHPGGVHIHGMGRQINRCWNWEGLELVGEKGRTHCARGLRARAPVVPREIPQDRRAHQQEQINFLYYLAKGKIINEAETLATATATAILGRTSAYTGRKIAWREMMEDPKLRPEIYDQRFVPTAEDFEQGNIALPREGAIALPGK